MKMEKLERGTLWDKTLERTEHALTIGALKPITTESMLINDSGVDFLVRIISSLARKVEEKGRGEEKGERKNPFLPYEEDLFVSHITDTHVCLLNKFNVIDYHLLIVTRLFEDQEMLLNRQDFEAIWTCMAEFEGLAFYNGGEAAGASQRHKHLQMIPMPMMENGPKVPIEPLFAGAGLEGDLFKVPGLPFVHSYVRLAPDMARDISRATRLTFSLYRSMLEAVGLNRVIEAEQIRQSGPYNLIFTREWMMLVPRSVEFYESISINALGFVGALLVQNRQQLKLVKRCGAMSVLKQTAIVA
jgi:sulfate adenylyltransferase (ADP) / ATP adenylyltransferase